MKEGFAMQRVYLGIDVSKDTLDVSCLTQAGSHCYQQFEKTKAGLQNLNRWLLRQDTFRYASILFCLEHTGIYTRRLVDFLLIKKAKVWMESALNLKRRIGMV